jgi:hypothetical protein
MVDVSVGLLYQGTNSSIKEDLETYFSVIFLKTSSKWITKSEFTGNGTFTGFTWNTQIEKTVKCAENRFGNDTVGRGVN